MSECYFNLRGPLNIQSHKVLKLKKGKRKVKNGRKPTFLEKNLRALSPHHQLTRSKEYFSISYTGKKGMNHRHKTHKIIMVNPDADFFIMEDIPFPVSSHSGYVEYKWTRSQNLMNGAQFAPVKSQPHSEESHRSELIVTTVK